MLVKQRDALDTVLKVGPLALNNLALTYNPQAGTLDTRANLGRARRARSRPTRRSTCAASTNQVKGAAGVCDTIKEILPRSGAPAGGLRPCRRRPDLQVRPESSADSWGCGDEDARGARRGPAGGPAADGLRLRRLQAAAARRPGRRRRPDDDQGPVRRRARPGAPSRRSRSTTSPSARCSRRGASTGYTAEVTLELRNDVELPDNAVAEIRQTSLLGEKFVSLGRRPSRAPAPTRSRAATRSRSSGPAATPRSRRSSARSACCSTAVASPSSRPSPRSSTSPSRAARARRSRCCSRSAPSWASSTTTRPTSSPRSRSSTGSRSRCARSSRRIDAALDELPSALDSIDRQREDLVTMLEALDELSWRRRPGHPASKDATIDSLELLDPVLVAAGRVGRRLRQRLPRLPDLPVRRRGRRARPAGGPQPPHGRLHQPVDHPRDRPQHRRDRAADAAHQPAHADRPDRDRQQRAGLPRQR